MFESFTYNGKTYGVGTIVRYTNTYGNELTKTVYKITPKSSVFKKRIYLSASIEDLSRFKYEQIDDNVFEKFAIIDILGYDSTAFEWEKKAEELRKTREDEMEKKKSEIAEYLQQKNSLKTDANNRKPNQETPSKPRFSVGMLCCLAIIAFFWLLYTIINLIEGATVQWGAWFLGLFLFIGVPFAIYLIPYGNKWYDYYLAKSNYPKYLERMEQKKKAHLAYIDRKIDERIAEQAEIDVEYEMAIASQNATEPWAVRYSTSPCPYCGHYKVRYAKWGDKSMSVAFWGIASSKIGTNYKCEHCKRMWE